jgi:hypothetical protein
MGSAAGRQGCVAGMGAAMLVAGSGQTAGDAIGMTVPAVGGPAV